MDNKIDANDIPNEVLFVWQMQHYRQPVGSDLYEKIIDIIERHPNYFVWEHAYKSIPKKVHKAYEKELHPNGEAESKKCRDAIVCREGLTSFIESTAYQPTVTDQDFIDLMTSLQDREDKDRAEKIRTISIWNKHYKKYKLSYRDGY